MYTYVLIPPELSLALSLQPNPLHIMEMAATVRSNTHLSPGLVLYPEEGEMRLNTLDTRGVLRDDDIRRLFGCFDTIVNINGQEIRHCNWVRFLRATNDPGLANVISSKVRGTVFFQVIRPVKPSEEIVVLFHVSHERTFYDWRQTHPPHLSFLSPPSIQDVHTAMMLRQSGFEKPAMLTSTPVSMVMPTNDKHYMQEGKRRSAMSSSSSSSFASPIVGTPLFAYKCSIPLESSSSSSVQTSTSGSSRETTASEEHLCPAPRVASPESSVDSKSDILVDDGEKEATHNEVETGQVERIRCEEKPEFLQVPKPLKDVKIELDVTPDVAKDSSIETNSIVDTPKLRGKKKPVRLLSVVQKLDITSSTGQEFYSSEKETKPNGPRVTIDDDNEAKHFFSSSQQSEIQRSDVSDYSEQVTSLGNNSDDITSTEINLDQNKLEAEAKGNENEERALSLNNKHLFCQRPPSSQSLHSLDTEPVTSQSHQPMKRCRERAWWTCDVCGKKFDRPSLLKRHMRTHTGEKPHACDVCGKAFSTSSSLNTHRRIHSGEKPHQCKICGKRFTASSNLYYHRMTHNKEKPHKCEMCSKSFPTPGDLRSHMYIHNGSWPYRCDVCSRGFSKQTNLKNHMLLHSGDKPHDCNKCGKRFALLCNLKTHLKTHEGSDSSDSSCCSQCGSVLDRSSDVINSKCGACNEIKARPSKGHTDFSISKLTSSDPSPKSSNGSRTTTMSAFGSAAPGTKTLVDPPHLAAQMGLHPQQYLPFMYRQLYTGSTMSSDQHPWYVPNTHPLHHQHQPLTTALKPQGSSYTVASLTSTGSEESSIKPDMSKLTAQQGRVMMSLLHPQDMMTMRGAGPYHGLLHPQSFLQHYPGASR